MSEYGKTIRKIRKGKKILQKELYEGIVSNTYAVQFEKGVHEINVVYFHSLLKRLNISFEEFIYFHEGYQDQEFQHLKQMALEAISAQDVKAMHTYIEKFAQFTSREAKIFRLICTFLSELDRKKQEEAKKEMLEYLSKIEEWTFLELVYFTNLIPFLPEEIIEGQIRQIERKIVKYQYLGAFEELYCSFMVNLIHFYLNKKRYEIAKSYSAKLYEFSENPSRLFYRLIADVYLDVFALMKQPEKDKTRKLEKVRRSLKFLEQYGYSQIAKDLELEINKLIAE